MAEFPEFTVHCELSTCGRVDFLPQRCALCHRSYCADHVSSELHACPVSLAPRETSTVPLAALATYKCHHCSAQSISQITCPQCELQFCLTHRSPLDHDCTVQPTVDESASHLPHRDDLIFKQCRGKAKTIVALQRHNKVNVMRLKKVAVGETGIIPDEFRRFVWMNVPEHGEEKLGFVIDKSWTIGRTVASVSRHLKLPTDGGARTIEFADGVCLTPDAVLPDCVVDGCTLRVIVAGNGKLTRGSPTLRCEECYFVDTSVTSPTVTTDQNLATEPAPATPTTAVPTQPPHTLAPSQLPAMSRMDKIKYMREKTKAARPPGVALGQLVYATVKHGELSAVVCLCKSWSIGRAIDAVGTVLSTKVEGLSISTNLNGSPLPRDSLVEVGIVPDSIIYLVAH